MGLITLLIVPIAIIIMGSLISYIVYGAYRSNDKEIEEYINGITPGNSWISSLDETTIAYTTEKGIVGIYKGSIVPSGVLCGWYIIALKKRILRGSKLDKLIQKKYNELSIK